MTLRRQSFLIIHVDLSQVITPIARKQKTKELEKTLRAGRSQVCVCVTVLCTSTPVREI